MTISTLKAVIVGISNAEESNVHVEKGQENEVTELIFNKLRSKKRTNTIQLPYLQVFLDNLYLSITGDETREKEATITVDSLNNIGDIDDVLKDFLIKQVDIISKKLTEKTPGKPISVNDIWTVLVPLTTMDGTKEPQSKRQLFEKVTTLSDDAISDVIEECSKSRILRHNDESDIYEVAHDALALSISTKRSESDVALLEIREMIKNKMALGRNTDDFFTQKQIDLIEPFLQFKLLKLGPDEMDLLKRSKDDIQSKKRKRKIRRISYAAAAGVFLLTVFLFYQNIQEQELKIARNVVDAKASALIRQEQEGQLRLSSDIIEALDGNVRLREIIAAEELDKSLIPRESIMDIRFESKVDRFDFSTGGKEVFRYFINPSPEVDTDDWSSVIYKLTVSNSNTAGPGGSKAEMRNSILMAGRDKGFRIDYDGYTCVLDIVALIEFKNPKRKSEIAMFNGCKILVNSLRPIEGRGK